MNERIRLLISRLAAWTAMATLIAVQPVPPAAADERIERADPGEEPDHRVFRRLPGQVQPRLARDLDDGVRAVSLAAFLHLPALEASLRSQEVAQAVEGQGSPDHARIVEPDRG